MAELKRRSLDTEVAVFDPEAQTRGEAAEKTGNGTIPLMNADERGCWLGTPG
jgi:hypothetical protein